MIGIAMNRQFVRYNSSLKHNESLTSQEVNPHIQLTPTTKQLLSKAADSLPLSAHSYFKVIKVAHTNTDLADEDSIAQAHIAEVL